MNKGRSVELCRANTALWKCNDVTICLQDVYEANLVLFLFTSSLFIEEENKKWFGQLFYIDNQLIDTTSGVNRKNLVHFIFCCHLTKRTLNLKIYKNI